jgi:hypothetical protein
MSEESSITTHGCMTCKGQHAYPVEHFPPGNTGWRCVDCGQILCLIPVPSPQKED